MVSSSVRASWIARPASLLGIIAFFFFFLLLLLAVQNEHDFLLHDLVSWNYGHLVFYLVVLLARKLKLALGH